MTPAGSILLVDDDLRFGEVYRELLAGEGYDVALCASSEEALGRLGASPPDLVLLDRKLQGKAGADTGLDLLDEVHRLAPATRVILITGYADADSVKRAFAAGVYDYLEKNAYFEELLRIKVRNALEAPRERRFAALANGKREAVIAELWLRTTTESDAGLKGRLLEDLLLLMLKSIPGFERAERDTRSADEQFDIIVPNESDDAFWSRESQYLLVECKHWSGKVDPAEIDRLQQKLQRRHGRCRLGFLVAPGGFTAGVESTLAANRKESEVVVPVGDAELEALATAGSGAARSSQLKALHQRAVVRG